MTQEADTLLTICLLGDFALIKGGQAISSLNAERPQSLLAYLLLHRQAPISRQHLAYTFWPDSSDEQARTNLRNLLHTLRRNLPDADNYLLFDTHTVQWRPDATYSLDVTAFQDALAAAKQAESWYDRRENLKTAISLYKGLLLPGNYDDWLIPIREELQQSYLEALSQLAHLLADMDDDQTAIQYARLWLRQDPVSEAAVILLMQLFAKTGDQAAVRRTYQACVKVLREELDAEPGTETQIAYADAVQHAASGSDLDDETGETDLPRPARASPRQLLQVPPHPTSFFGREAEMARLAEWLANPHCRLVTIVGPSGIGKTRLALQTAYGHVTVFTGGAAYVSLAAVNDPTILPSVIALGLRFQFNTASSRRAQLLQYLTDKELLLVLDNMELLDDNAAFLAEMLAVAPQVKLLVTAPRHLNLQEEWVFHLQGLPLPAANDLQSIAESSAVALFLHLAQRRNASFVPTEADLKAIGHICRLVDGMPLGLELAAPWVRLLSCAEIGAEIEKNLDFLTSSQSNVPERHRSMRAVFNHSWEMLTQTEKTVFSCLSLFVSGFSREGAEQVAGATLPVLSELVDKSLVRRLADGRYEIHELLCQYASHQLATTAEQLATAQVRYAAYYVMLAEMAIKHLVGPDQKTWLDQLELEYDNLRAALSWAVETEEVETAMRLGAALSRYWWLRYRPVEGGNWLRKILALPGPPSEHRARAMSYAGLLARLRRDYAESEAWLVQSASYQRQGGNLQDLGRSLNELGMLHMDQGQYDQAYPFFAEWLELARQLEFPHGISIALLNLGMVRHYLGDFDRAEIYYQESLSVSRQLGLKTNTAMVLTSYSMLLLDQKRLESARSMLLESVQLNLELGHKDGLSWAFLGLLTQYYLEGNLESAACLVGVLETMRHALGAPFPPTNQLHLENIVKDLRQQLGLDVLATHAQRGREMSLSAVVAFVQK